MFVLVEVDIFHDPAWMLFAAVTMTVSALAHGALGFGFPLISTPVIAMVADMRTAVLITVLPNLAVNVVSIVRGGRWRESLGRHGLMALWVLLGTLVGTHLLLSVDPAPLKLLLALMIAIYLAQDRIKMLDWTIVARYPQVSGMLLGILAGVLSGAVNVALPPLVIYFMALGLAPLAMTQILNLCFLVGKSTQAVAFAMAGQFSTDVLWLSVPLVLLSVLVLLLGMRLQRGIRPEAYRRIVFVSLGIIGLLLVGQSLLSITRLA